MVDIFNGTTAEDRFVWLTNTTGGLEVDHLQNSIARDGNQLSPVPLPAGLQMLLGGLGSLALYRRGES